MSVEAGRTLTDTAASQCPRCTGLPGAREYKFDVDGSILGVMNRVCDHRPAAEGEMLLKAKKVPLTAV